MKNYLDIYNNFIKLTRNLKFYNDLNLTDDFSTRLILYFIHFSFFLKIFKNKENKEHLQRIYDFNFKQLELNIREIGYGDQSINKKMKDYINLFHSIVSDIHFWDDLIFKEKSNCLKKYLENLDNNEFLVRYFEDFSLNLKKYDLNSYLKSVCKD
jgi:cytochrome b pre-mRNA-processing protein 3